MTVWPAHIDARLTELIANGFALGVVSAKLGRSLSSVSLRAVEIGAIAHEDVPSVDTERMPWPKEWLRPRCSAELAAQAALCRQMWADVFRFVVLDEIDQITRSPSRDRVAVFLRGYLSRRSAADVLYLAGFDPDVVLPRLRQVARDQGLCALRTMLAGFEKKEAMSQ